MGSGCRAFPPFPAPLARAISPASVRARLACLLGRRDPGESRGFPPMPPVTFQVLEGIDKGRVFRDLQTPVTIGREEGNVLRLNDERVSRFHAKVQFDNGEYILTDLESTNGTRINGNVVQIRRLRPGDRVGVGRSLLLYGSDQEIAARLATLSGVSTPAAGGSATSVPATVHAHTLASQFGHDDFFDLNPRDKL